MASVIKTGWCSRIASGWSPNSIDNLHNRRKLNLWFISFSCNGSFTHSYSWVCVIIISVWIIFIDTALFIIRFLLINVSGLAINIHGCILLEVRSGVLILATLSLGVAITCFLWKSTSYWGQGLWRLNSDLTDTCISLWRYQSWLGCTHRCLQLRCCCICCWFLCLLRSCRCLSLLTLGSSCSKIILSSLRLGWNNTGLLLQGWPWFIVRIFISCCRVTIFALCHHCLFLCSLFLFSLLSSKLNLDPVHSPNECNLALSRCE